MSLKAKIEAVIYAAEEPVTLTQLASTFASEVPLMAPVTPADDLRTSSSSEMTIIDDAGVMHEAMPTDPALEATIEKTPVAADPAASQESSPMTVDVDAAAKRTSRQLDRAVRDYLRTIVDELIADYALQDRGIEIREIAGGFRMATKPEYHDVVRVFVKNLKPPMKLSLQALETLAVIAYKQPVTAPEVGDIRGVDSGGVLASLISRKLITTAGRKQVVGRPILYKTTNDFLLRFGLKDIGELPSMEEFEKIAVELNEEPIDEINKASQSAGSNAEPLSQEIIQVADEEKQVADTTLNPQVAADREESSNV